MIPFFKPSLSKQDIYHQAVSKDLKEHEAFEKLDALNAVIEEQRKGFIGYPCNASFKLDKFFRWWTQSSLSKAPLNDVGNPFSPSSYKLNARSFELEVLHYFAELYSLKSYWGYTTSGGTQGNEQGLFMGRQSLQKYGKPILYYSEEAHYSIASLAKILDLEACAIRAKANGEMDYAFLESKLNPLRPALFSLSIGTTFKGAVDSIDVTKAIVERKGVEHVFYHADAALFGGYLPFYESKTKPKLNFELEPYDSIAVSGHKFFGSPIPLGIFLIREHYKNELHADYIEYIHSHNTTIPCSRSALNTLILWWIVTTTSREEFVTEVDQIMVNTHYLYKKLWVSGYPVWQNEHSNTVFFRAPPLEISEKWTLSLQTCSRLGQLAHAVIMQHVDRKLIDEFIADLGLS